MKVQKIDDEVIRYFYNNKEINEEEWFGIIYNSHKAKDGIYYRYYGNGFLCSADRYKNGKKHGAQEFYLKDGRLGARWYYVEGDKRLDLLLPENRLTRVVLFGEDNEIHSTNELKPHLTQ